MVDIEDWHDLDDVRNDLTEDYVLVNDLTPDTPGYDDHASETANGGEGWDPIGGATSTNGFSGQLDGGGNTIRGLFIARDGQNNALIRRMNGSAEVYDLGFIDANVTGLDEGGVVDGERTGALAGENHGDIYRCFATRRVQTEADTAGVLVGDNRPDATIENAYVIGRVEGGDPVGFVAGGNLGTVEWVYGADPPDVDTSTVRLTGSGGASGSYYDNDPPPGTGSELDTSQMTGTEAAENMDAFDFSSVWETVSIDDGDTFAPGYPILQSIDRNPQLEAQGVVYPDLPRAHVPARGWHAEISRPNPGSAEPQILDTSQLTPRLNALPEVRLDVPKNETYLDESYEQATLSVWRDGQRLPIDEVADIEPSTRHDTLVGIGGTDLERRVSVDVAEETVPDLVRDLVETETDMVANVDDYPAMIAESVPIARLETAADWEQFLLSSIWGLLEDETHPLHLDGDQIDCHQTSFFVDATEASSDNTELVENEDFHDGEGEAFISDIGDILVDLDFDYEIPGEHLTAIVRDRHLAESGEDEAMGMRIELQYDGQSFEMFEIDNFNESETLNWFVTVTADDPPSTIDPSEPANITILPNDPGDLEGRLEIDCINIFDGRFEPDLSESLDGNNQFDVPRNYPPEIEIETQTFEQFRRAVAGELEVQTDDPTGAHRLELSANNGVDWIDAEDADVLDDEFDVPGPLLRARVTIGAYDDPGRTETPLLGTEFQALDWLDIHADLDDTPLVLNQSFDGDLLDTLRRIADGSDAVFEIRQDGVESSLEWAWPGQRSREGVDPDLVDFDMVKHNRRTLRVTVKGGNSPIRNEGVEADLEEPVDLSQTDVTPSSVIVRDASGEQRYRQAFDYEVRGNAGELVFIDTGDIDDEQSLLVDYEFRVSGTFEHTDFDGDPRQDSVFSIPQLSSVRGCEQAAKVLVDELSVPQWEGSATFPADADVPLIEALDHPDIPGPAESVYDVLSLPDSLRVQLGNRRSGEEIVRRIRDQLSAASELV